MLLGRLAVYVARPVKPAGFAAAAAACFALGSWGIKWGGAQEPVADGFAALSLLGVGLVLGACTGFVVARDVDRAEGLLVSMPRSFAGPLCARFAAWLTISLAVVSTLAVRSAPALNVDTERAIAVSLIPFFVSAGVAAVAGRLTAALIGAGIGLGAGAFYLAVSMFIPEWGMSLPLDPTRPDFGNDLGSTLVAASGMLMTSVAVIFVTLRRTAGGAA